MAELLNRSLRIAAVAALLAACGAPSAPGGAETITGSERFGWDQPASDAGELASFRYAIYVDDSRTEVADVSCAAPAASGRFACTARLPEMSAGNHTLRVASFVNDGGGVRESPQSTPLRVVKR
jgi:hypothetical protein